MTGDASAPGRQPQGAAVDRCEPIAAEGSAITLDGQAARLARPHLDPTEDGVVAEVARLVRQRRHGAPEMRDALILAWMFEPGALLERFGARCVRELMWACRHPHPVTAPTRVYRGGNASTLIASWSLCPAVAAWFAIGRLRGSPGPLLTGIVHPDDVLFWLGTNEREVLPLYVRQIERLDGNRWIRRLAERHDARLVP
jgi:hypothetical protein